MNVASAWEGLIDILACLFPITLPWHHVSLYCSLPPTSLYPPHLFTPHISLPPTSLHPPHIFTPHISLPPTSLHPPHLFTPHISLPPTSLYPPHLFPPPPPPAPHTLHAHGALCNHTSIWRSPRDCHMTLRDIYAKRSSPLPQNTEKRPPERFSDNKKWAK